MVDKPGKKTKLSNLVFKTRSLKSANTVSLSFSSLFDLRLHKSDTNTYLYLQILAVSEMAGSSYPLFKIQSQEEERYPKEKMPS